MSNNERVDRAHVRANRAFEGELVFEGEWVPPTPFNGIAFLASGVVLRHLHRRTQARGAPHPSSIAHPKTKNEARPSEPRRDAPRPTRPRLTKSTRPPLLAENGTQNANRRGRGDTERRPWWRRRRIGNRAPDDEYENENGNNRPRPRWTAAENVVGDDPRGRFVAVIPHSREEGSNDAREGVEGTHEGTRSVVRRSESEDDLMRLAATSREAHLRNVAAAMAARDGGDGARGVEVPRTEVPPRDVGDVASVSPASSALLAEVESLPEPARSQIEFFRRLSVESARPEEDGRGTIATGGGGAEGGAEVSQLCAEGGAESQLCATVPPARGTDPDEPEQRTCRFCLGGEDEGAAGDDALIAPCRCRGTQGWVHHGCLREWQRVSVSSTGRVERRCRVCHSAFRTPRPPIKEVIKEWCVSFSPFYFRHLGNQNDVLVCSIQQVQSNRHRPAPVLPPSVVADAQQLHHGARGRGAHRHREPTRPAVPRHRAEGMGRAGGTGRERNTSRRRERREAGDVSFTCNLCIGDWTDVVFYSQPPTLTPSCF